MLDWQAYGLWAGGHHLTNVVIHAATVVGLFLVLTRMTGRLWPSALVAALFAIHPLRAESVAWVAERKDVLAGLFFVLTLWAYVEYAGRPFSTRRYLLVVACFALGLMAKPMLVTVPGVLLLLDYWPLGGVVGGGQCAVGSGRWMDFGFLFSLPCPPPTAHRPLRRLILEKLPLLTIAGMSAAVTVWAQQEALRPLEHLPFSARLADAAVAYVAYLGKFFLPVQLAAFYPLPRDGWPIWEVAAACVILAGLSGAVIAARRSQPYLLVGWLWYLGMLLPVIGIVQVGEQAMADRYTYLPQIGLSIALVWGGADFFDSRPAGAWFRCLAVGGVLVALMICTSRQTASWRNNATLWTQALACTQENYVAHERMGSALIKTHRPSDAVEHFRQSLGIKPEFAPAHCGWGKALVDLGHIDEALQHYRQALLLDPDNVEALNNLGNAMCRLGRPAEGISYYQRALHFQPDRAEAHNNLGNALQDVGRVSEAVEHYRTAAQIKPDYAEAYGNCGLRPVPCGADRGGIRSIRLGTEAAAGFWQRPLQRGALPVRAWSPKRGGGALQRCIADC